MFYPYFHKTINTKQIKLQCTKWHRYQTSVAWTSLVFWEGGARTFLIRVSATWDSKQSKHGVDISTKRVCNEFKKEQKKEDHIEPTNLTLWLCTTSCGDPRSRMSCLLVGIIVMLTFSSGSITSLNTLSCPSMTTSCLKRERKIYVWREKLQKQNIMKRAIQY